MADVQYHLTTISSNFYSGISGNQPSNKIIIPIRLALCSCLIGFQSAISGIKSTTRENPFIFHFILSDISKTKNNEKMNVSLLLQFNENNGKMNGMQIVFIVFSCHCFFVFTS